jgi:hypothetical protein
MLIFPELCSECVSPASDRLVLLNWVNVLVACVLKQVTLEAAKTNAMFATILNAQAVLIDSLVDNGRKSIGKSAIADVRRTIRLLADAIPTMIDVALANAQTCAPSYKNAVLIGAIIDVSLRLKNRSDGKSMIESAESRLTEYYLKNVVSSRTAVHTAALDSFNDFISQIVTKEKFEAEYLPVLDKMMLRSPEIVLLGKLYSETSDIYRLLISIFIDSFGTYYTCIFIRPLINFRLKVVRSSSQSFKVNFANNCQGSKGFMGSISTCMS